MIHDYARKRKTATLCFTNFQTSKLNNLTRHWGKQFSLAVLTTILQNSQQIQQTRKCTLKWNSVWPFGCALHVARKNMIPIFLIDYFNHFIGHDFYKIWWLLKEPFICVSKCPSNRQSRTKCDLVSSERTPHPWLWRLDGHFDTQTNGFFRSHQVLEKS